MTRSSSAALAVILLVACSPRPNPDATPAAAAPVKAVFHPVPGRSDLPFSAAVRVGDMLYLSGDIGTDSTGTLVKGGIQPETRQALENIKATLEKHGATLADVVKCTAMLADMREWAKMNEVYVTFFTEHLPARSAFGTSGLALGARMELECFAYLGGK